jgi:hypothetical protein
MIFSNQVINNPNNYVYEQQKSENWYEKVVKILIPLAKVGKHGERMETLDAASPFKSALISSCTFEDRWRSRLNSMQDRVLLYICRENAAHSATLYTNQRLLAFHSSDNFYFYLGEPLFAAPSFYNYSILCVLF